MKFVYNEKFIKDYKQYVLKEKHHKNSSNKTGIILGWVFGSFGIAILLGITLFCAYKRYKLNKIKITFELSDVSTSRHT